MYNSPFKESSYQVDYLKECYSFFGQLKVVNTNGKDMTNKMKFINGWKTSINGLLELWDKLKSLGFKYVFTRRLHQDCIKNLFGSICQQSGNNINPTATQFQQAFKNLSFVNLLHSDTENCEEDNSKLLLTN